MAQVSLKESHPYLFYFIVNGRYYRKFVIQRVDSKTRFDLFKKVFLCRTAKSKEYCTNYIQGVTHIVIFAVMF